MRPLPYPESGRLVRIWETFSEGKGRGSVSLDNFRDWRSEADRFESLGAYWPGSRNLQVGAEPERLRTLELTASMWDVLRTRPIAGRLFAESDEVAGAAPVAVLSEGLWRRRFGGDPGAIGTSLMLDGVSHVVVGVVPASFRFPLYGDPNELYLPHVVNGGRASRGNHYLSVVGRLRDGADLEGARAQMEAIAKRLEAEYPDSQTGRSVELRMLAESIRGPVRPALLVLFGAVVLVLLIACANLAGLAMARAEERRRDASIRAALGAARGQLVRRYLAEGLLLATAGAALGAVLAGGILAVVRPWAARTLPDLGPLAIDPATFLFLLGVAVLTALVFGTVPALALPTDRVARELVEAGTRNTAGRGSHRLRRALVAAQVGLSLTLLVGAGLLLRTFRNLSNTAPGFDKVGVVTMHIAPARSDRESGALTRELLDPIVERLEARPGIESAGFFSILPIQNWGNNTSYSIEGQPPPAPGDDWWIESRAASADAFRALGVPLKAGRFLTAADGALDPEDESDVPVIVNEAVVRRHFPDGDAIGKGIHVWGATARIVGVVGDVRQAGLDREPLPEMTVVYNDVRLESMLRRDVVLVVRSSLPTSAVTAAVREVVLEVDPMQPLHTVRTLDQVLDESLGQRQLTLTLVAAFALLAALLAGTGLYALIAYLVAQRRREIGVRMALGASAREIGGRVVSEGVTLAGAGIVVGVAGGVAATRLLTSQLYGVGRLDPWTWTGVIAVVLALAAAASISPALAAARTEPSSVLRDE